MARRRDEENEREECKYCHRQAFERMMHLLRMGSDERVIAKHLEEEYPTPKGKDDRDNGFVKSEVMWWRFNYQKYGNKATDDGSPLPRWLAFAMDRAKVIQTGPKRWHIEPKESDDLPLEEWMKTKKERFTKSYTVRKFMATHGNPSRPWMLYDWEK